jgi:hypothetical protein
MRTATTIATGDESEIRLKTHPCRRCGTKRKPSKAAMPPLRYRSHARGFISASDIGGAYGRP